MNNQEVHQAILDTFDMWCDFANPDPGLLREHLDALLHIQAARLRMTVELEGERFFKAIEEQHR